MSYWWLLLIIIPFIILLAPIKVIITFTEKLDFKIKFFGIVVYKNDGKKAEKNTLEEDNELKNEPSKKSPTEVLDNVKVYIEIIRDILVLLDKFVKNHLVIEKLNFEYTFGLGDAALTGIFSGGVYTVVNVFYSFIFNNFKLKKHLVKINPDFDKECMKIDFCVALKITLIGLLAFICSERDALNKLLKKLKRKMV